MRTVEDIPDDLISKPDTDDPLQIQESFSKIFEIISKIEDNFSLLIDITTFRREELLVLLKKISGLESKILQSTYFLYSLASSMGSWLSNNVRDLRPIIGYPGEINNYNPTHLIILAGIEDHRAKAAIEAYEPKSISLGMVPQSEATSEVIYERNLSLRNYLKRHFDQVSLEFDFSATDPCAVKETLKKIVADLPDYNVVIAPLNTKLSTLGVGAFAIENPKVQLCYAEVEVYNSGDYSEAGNKVYIVPYADILKVK